MSRSRYRIFEHEYPYFLTSTVVAWLPVFARPSLVKIVLDSWRFLQHERGVRIFGYVVMENHLHWIASGEHLSEQVGQFKSFTARSIIDEVERLPCHAAAGTVLFQVETHSALRIPNSA